MGNRIRQLRLELGLTQAALGQSIGTTGQEISRLEKGERGLTLKWMERIARGLSVKPAALLIDSAPDYREFAKNTEEVMVLRWWRLLDPRDKRTIAVLARDKGIEILAHHTKKRSRRRA